MTALAEALLAAQRQAIGALAKPYVVGTIEAEDVTARLEAIGCTDMTARLEAIGCTDTIDSAQLPNTSRSSSCATTRTPPAKRKPSANTGWASRISRL